MIINIFKSALRNMLRHKAFSFINICGLTLGLTACVLIGLLVRDEQRFDKFIPDGDLIYRIVNVRTGVDGTENMTGTPPAFVTFLKSNYAGIDKAVRILRIQSKDLFEAENKKFYEEGGLAPEEDFFEIFPLHFIYGSPVDALKDPSAIVLSENMAVKFFGKTNPVGKQMLFNKTSFIVKGVYKNDPHFHLQPSYTVPLASQEIPEDRMNSWVWQQFYSYIKLKRGIDIQVVQSAFQNYIRQKIDPVTKQSAFSYLPFFQPLNKIHLYSSDFKFDLITIRGNITYVRALSIIAIFILIIACFNFVNMATARALQRAKEVGVRKTIGASRKQMVMHYTGETFLYAFAGLLMSVLLVYLLLPPLNAFTEKDMQFNLLSNPLLILILIGLTSITGMMAGIYPAYVLANFKPVEVLKSDQTGTASHSKTPWIRHSLVVVQFALSVLLIISSIVVIKQVNYLHHKDLGLNKDQIMFFPMRGDNMYKNYSSFKNSLLQTAGISSVSIGYGFPGDMFAGDNIVVPGADGEATHYATQLLVDHDYIKTFELSMIAGRDFSKEIKSDNDHAFIINETAVKELGFGTPENAIGKNLLWHAWTNGPDSIKRGQVIGVVKDFNYKSLYDKIETTVLQIYPDAYWKVAVKIKADGIANSIASVKKIWNEYSPDYPIEYTFLDENFKLMYESEDKLKSLLWIFTSITIFVACLGLFGLAAYSAERRKREVGIRKVLGASVSGVVILLSRDFIRLVLIALVIASPVAWYFMNRWLQDFAYRIEINGWIFLSGGMISILIALITVGFQAVKAAVENPVKVIR
jgi:putative ABC transport system permease protein